MTNKFQDDGYHVWMDNDNSGGVAVEPLSQEHFTFGFCAPWQWELLLGTASKFISLDATYDVS